MTQQKQASAAQSKEYAKGRLVGTALARNDEDGEGCPCRAALEVRTKQRREPVRRFSIAAAGLLVVTLVAPVVARADVITIGDPYPIGSWAQRFQEDGVTFDKMEIFFINGAPGTGFESPGFRNFTNVGWGGSLVNPGYALALGSPLGWLQFDIAFLGLTSQTFAFDFFAYRGAEMVDKAHATWNGGWSITATGLQDPTGNDYNRSVPEPTTTLSLLGIGLAGMWLARRRRT